MLITMKKSPLLIARQKQANAGFGRVEEKFKRKCESTNGRVKYRPPMPTESAYNISAKRRQAMLDELVPFMSVKEKRSHSAAMRSHGNFKRCDEELERRCNETKGSYEVVYDDPTDTELWRETRARRKRLRRKLEKYNQFQNMVAYLKEMSKKWPQRKIWMRMGLDLLNESITVKCPLGPKHCPCHGIRHKHICFTRKLSDEEYFKMGSEICQECRRCGNTFDPRESNALDKLFRLYSLQKEIIIKDYREIVGELRPYVPMPEPPQVTYVQLKRLLYPSVAEIMDSNATTTREAQRKFHGTKEASILNDYWDVMERVSDEIVDFALKKFLWEQRLAPRGEKTGRDRINELIELVKSRKSE